MDLHVLKFILFAPMTCDHNVIIRMYTLGPSIFACNSEG